MPLRSVVICLPGTNMGGRCQQSLNHANATQVDYLRVCRQRWGPYTLRCNQYTALACNAPSLFVIPMLPRPKSWRTVLQRCSEQPILKQRDRKLGLINPTDVVKLHACSLCSLIWQSMERVMLSCIYTAYPLGTGVSRV